MSENDFNNSVEKNTECIGLLDKRSLDNHNKINENQKNIKQIVAGVAEHDKKLKELDRLINMMVDCGTAKDLEREIVKLHHRIKVASTFLSDLIASVKAGTMEIHPHDRDVLLAKLKDIEFKLQKDD